jgi:hypothetical protein
VDWCRFMKVSLASSAAICRCSVSFGGAMEYLTTLSVPRLHASYGGVTDLLESIWKK